jgi:predicted Rossmann fold nucleotide-binding protein DprA/Smf involved in DNA uptake
VEGLGEKMSKGFSEVANIPRGEIDPLPYKQDLLKFLGKENLTTEQVALRLKISVTNALEVLMSLERESRIYKYKKHWHLR